MNPYLTIYLTLLICTVSTIAPDILPEPVSYETASPSIHGLKEPAARAATAFRLGSGAAGSDGPVAPRDCPGCGIADGTGAATVGTARSNKETETETVWTTSTSTTWKYSALITLVNILDCTGLAAVCCMMPFGNQQHHQGHHHGRHHGSMGNPQLSHMNFSDKIPPAWDPEHEHSYSFNSWQTDLSFWISITSLQPHQQAAAITMRLGGVARDMARMMTPYELVNGGMINGVQVS